VIFNACVTSLFLILAILLSQWTGINVILYYAAALFTRMGIEESHASTSLVIVNALLLFLGTVPGMVLVEHRYGIKAHPDAGVWLLRYDIYLCAQHSGPDVVFQACWPKEASRCWRLYYDSQSRVCLRLCQCF
jgi:hypothetical protein